MAPTTDRRREIRDAYDRIAELHDKRRSGWDAPEMDLVRSFAGDLIEGERVLDAGCGAGEPVTAHLAERFDVTGLDFSREQLDIASIRLSSTEFVQADMTSLPFDDDSFDALCSLYAVIHVPWERHGETFEEFHRVLRPGTPALITVGGEDWKGSNENWLDFGAEMHWSQPGPGRATNLLDAAGFEVEWCRGVRDDFGDAEGEKVFVLARA